MGGKSAITIRMVANEWRKEYDPTIEDSYTCMINVNGKNEQLDILDTAGQEQFAALQDHWIREAEAFVLVYIKISRIKDDKRIDLILVGNKSDLPMSDHEVKFDMGKKLADDWGVPFLETSAKTGDNVYEAFEVLVKEINTPKARRSSDASDQEFPTGKGGCCTIM